MRRFTVFAGLLALSSCQSPHPAPAEEAPAPETAPMSDEDQIRTRTDEFEQAVSAGDAKTIGTMFVEDSDLVDQAGGMHHGRAAIEDRYQKLFDGAYKGAQANLEITSIRFVRPDVAVIDGTYDLSAIKSPDGVALDAIRGMFTNIFVKANGEWRIHCSRPMVPLT
jgi:uncharacterized protein (TIGR02246 family)